MGSQGSSIQLISMNTSIVLLIWNNLIITYSGINLIDVRNHCKSPDHQAGINKLQRCFNETKYSENISDDAIFFKIWTYRSLNRPEKIPYWTTVKMKNILQLISCACLLWSTAYSATAGSFTPAAGTTISSTSVTVGWTSTALQQWVRAYNASEVKIFDSGRKTASTGTVQFSVASTDTSLRVVFYEKASNGQWQRLGLRGRQRH